MLLNYGNGALMGLLGAGLFEAKRALADDSHVLAASIVESI